MLKRKTGTLLRQWWKTDNKKTYKSLQKMYQRLVKKQFLTTHIFI